MKNLKKEQCPNCYSINTFLLGVSEWIHYHHCMSCGHDFTVDMREYAWTDKEIKKLKEDAFPETTADKSRE